MMEKKAVIDFKTLAELLNYEKNSKNILKIVNIFLVKEPVDKIIVTDRMLEKIEKLVEDKRYIALLKLLTDKEIYEFVDLNMENSLDDDLINYAIEENLEFASFDLRLGLKYATKTGVSLPAVEKNHIQKFLKIEKKIEQLNEIKIGEYINEIFKNGIKDPFDYIKLSEVERYDIILDFIVETELKNENQDVKDTLKKIILRNKSGEINERMLKKALSQLKDYNFGNLNLEETQYEKYQDLIAKFLAEKGFDSFEDLKNTQSIFETEESLIEKIVKYYSK